MKKNNLFKKTLVTSMCLAMVVSMTACGKKNETVSGNSSSSVVEESKDTSTTTSTTTKSSKYINEPVANKELVDADIDIWKNINSVGCSTSFDFKAANFTQEEFDNDVKEINDVMSKIIPILYSDDTFTADVSDLCTKSMSSWLGDDGTRSQLVYYQILSIGFLSKENCEVCMAAIYNNGTTDFTSTYEDCLLFKLDKANEQWKISKISNRSDSAHDNMVLSDMTLQMIQPWEDATLNTISGGKVPYFKIVGRSNY